MGVITKDERNVSPEFPCVVEPWTVTLDVSVNNQVVSSDKFALNMTITQVMLDLTNATAATVIAQLMNEDDNEIWTSGAQAKGAVRTLYPIRDITGAGLYWKLTFVAVEAADVAVPITAYGH